MHRGWSSRKAPLSSGNLYEQLHRTLAQVNSVLNILVSQEILSSKTPYFYNCKYVISVSHSASVIYKLFSLNDTVILM